MGQCTHTARRVNLSTFAARIVGSGDPPGPSTDGTRQPKGSPEATRVPGFHGVTILCDPTVTVTCLDTTGDNQSRNTRRTRRTGRDV